VTRDHNADPRRGLPLVRKIGWTALAGFITFSGSQLLDHVLHVSLADQLLLSVVTGGVTLLVQYLAEFEERLSLSERYHRQFLADLDAAIRRGFAGVSEATALHQEIEQSVLEKNALKQLIARAGHFTAATSPLVRRLAISEMARLSSTLQSLGDGHELFYDGEDRELLLALARNAQRSIMATALVTKTGLDVTFWYTDLAARYLDLQRAAMQRGVAIQRVFIFESAELAQRHEVTRILAKQHGMGIVVRLLGLGQAPPDGSITDIVVFDEEIVHETVPVARRDESGALTTRLVLDKELVQNRILRFQDLWRTAEAYPEQRRPELSSEPPS
jgi:hypothetical protein